METLQIKLHDAERKLSVGSGASSVSSRQSPIKVGLYSDHFVSIYYLLAQDDVVTVTGSRLTRPEEEVRGLVTRLMTEEDILRRDQMEMTNNLGDKVSYFISESQQQPLPAT